MEYKNLPYDELKALHREIGAHLAGMRDGEIQQLREKMAALGVSPADLIEKKPKKTNGAKMYQDPDNPENTYAGKGPKPKWLKDALDAGQQLEEFAV